MEEDSRYESKSPISEIKTSNTLPASSPYPSADNYAGPPLPTNPPLGSTRIPSVQDLNDSSSSLGIKPPQVGGGKPMYIKRGPGPHPIERRGPGRPRKDGTGKSPKPVMGLKKLAGLYIPPTSGNGRGVRGRKKLDGGPFVGGTNSVSATLGDLNLFNHESPPRFLDDTAESDTSSVASSFEKLHEDFSLFPEQWPGKLCALCNLGEKSMLGQGELVRLEIPNGFDPHSVSKGLVVSCKSEKDNSSDRSPKQNLSSRRVKGAKVKRLTSQGSLESMYEPVDEVVGYSEEPDLNNIFDLSSGFYYVHISCALWCDNAIRNDDGTFKNLEKEIVRALSIHCNHCGNLGASSSCKAPGCGNSLHFACAAASGGFQEITSRTILCVIHLDLAVTILGKAANCIVCNSPDGITSLLMCSSCGNHYHSACLALNSDPTIRAGWQCPACKICQACRQPGDDSKLLPCDACDKVYHIFCLRPALASCPKYSWKCKMCRSCTDCGARTPGSGPSSRWHANFSVCDSCYQQRNKGLACPVCGKAYRHVAQKHMVQCHQCRKYVHDACDPAAVLAAYHLKKEQNPDYEYSCTVCLNGPMGNNTSSVNPRVILSLKRSSDKDDGSSESNSMINSFTLSQDSFLSPEDNSLSGTENSNDLNWLEKTQGISVEEIRPPPSGRGKPLTGPFPRKKLGVGPHPIERRGLGRPKSTESKQAALPSNRRQRFTELQQRKRGPKPKMRGVFGAPGVGLQRPSIDSSHKCEDEPGVENRLVLCSSRDEFVLHQDVCVMCGAFGNDVEGRLISCAQCGQCYHPFCVNIKVTKVVLQKGWRCLDCTVCEGCGHRHDESRLILCDDCDISFHIYCMDPPLDYVPQGNWKCKWCVVCQLCGSNDPGPGSVWHNNYTLCGPCVSLNNCPVCRQEYTDGELIIQCTRCDRWLHASCDMITNENEAEKCADESYSCVLCRPHDLLPPHLQPPPVSILKAISPPRSPDLKFRPPQHFVVDGVSLSETGMSHIKSLTMELPRKKRKKMPNIADMEAGILAAIESVVSGSNNARPDGSEPDKTIDGTSDKDKESVKKKQRNLQKLGIGGFIVRLRGPRFRDDDIDAGIENQASSLDGDLKPKRKQPRKKIKNKIVESFPNYLQEAFFGKTLLDPCKDADFVSGDENDSEISPVITSDKYIKLSPDELKAIELTKLKKELSEKGKVNAVCDQASDTRVPRSDPQKLQLKHQIKIEEEDDNDDALQDILPLASDLLDNDLVNTIMNEGDGMKVDDGLEDLSAVDSALGDDGELSLDPTGGEDFLSSQFNLESIETGLPSMDSKDVEDIFKGVLTDESQESQDNLFPISSGPPPPQHPTSTNISSTLPTTPSSGPPSMLSQTINASVVLSTPGVQGSPGLSNRSQLQQNVQQGLASPISFPPPSPYHSEYSNSPQFSPAFSEPPSPWPTQVDSEQEAPSNYSQRSILKWEADEALGLNATISAVLYANTNHLELKREFPNWAERSKQIAKIWRGLSSEKRAPYLQKARENRAASRMQKSQQIQIPKENKSGGLPSKIQGQSPETEVHIKQSPSITSSTDVTIAVNSESSTSRSCQHLPNTSPGFISCNNLATTLPVAQSAAHTVQSSCMINNNTNTTTVNLSIPIHSTLPSNSSSSSAMSSAFTPSTAVENDAVAFSLSTSASKAEVTNSRCPVGDQHIRVLTPSEIMRTLPALSQESCQESCSFNPSLDQDKIVNGPISKQPIRGETNEERHWKQMQVFRQQQQQQQQIVLQEHRLQGEPSKDHLGGGSANMNLNTPKLQYSTVQRQLGNDAPHGTGTSEITRQPLQVSTSHELNMPGPQSSPHLQSPNSRQVFASTLQSSRPPRPPALEMPPPRPSPVLINSQASPTIRPPMYSRVPYMHSPRQQMASPSDPYANSPMTPQPSNVDTYSHPPSTPRPSVTEGEVFPNQQSEPYQQKIMQDSYMGGNITNSPNEMDISGSPRAQAPGQETRQHLRDLLQRQQIKKLEQEQMSPNCPEMLSPGTPRPVSSWSSGDWQKGNPVDPNLNQNFNQRHQLAPSSPQLQQNQFRHPFLHQHGRFNTSQPQQQQSMQSINGPLGSEFRPTQPNSQQQPPPQVLDSRVRLLLQQQRGLVQPQQLGPRSQLSFPMGHQQQQQMGQVQFRPGPRNPLDPYDHLVVQQQNRSGVVMSDGSGPSGSMLAQQLGRPLNSMVSPQQQQQQISSPPPSIQQHSASTVVASHLSPSRPPSGNSSVSQSHAVLSTQADHQELPDSVTAELEKLEQEQHNEAETGELVDMTIDDDELLGMGADFNILEYADPELDQAVGGEKTNILDNLDLEEEKEEEKDENKDLKRREHEKHVKRENTAFTNLGGPAQTTPTSVVPKIESGTGAAPNTVGLNTNQPNYGQHQQNVNPQQQQQQHQSSDAPILRPPQPPPYPVPPPPYPGRSQMGIRNGGGMSMQSMPSMMNMSMGLKSAQMGMGNIGGLRPTTQHLPSPPISSSCNPLMTLHQRRTLLLQEQPLLLEDLLEQEKREQQRQGPSLMAPEEPLLSDFDFERLKADVLSSSSLPVSLSPPNVSGQVILPPPVQQPKFTRMPSQMSSQMNAINAAHSQMNQPSNSSDWQVDSDNMIGNRRNISQPMEHNAIPLHPALAQSSGSNPNTTPVPTNRVPNFPVIPAPPTPPEHPANEQERQMQVQYEKWLYHQQQTLAVQLKYFEGEVNKLRKGKKSLNSKQRQLRKNGGELNEPDSVELERITRELAGLQKQLDQSRKQSRQHGVLIQDYRNKQQKRQQMMGMNASQNPSQTPTQASPLGPSSHSPLHSTPQSPILSPSPSMGGGPVSSPLMQHSPMASPLTPSPGPVSNLSQTSPRSIGQNMHHMDDRPFSPNNDNSMRNLASPQNNLNQNRMIPNQGNPMLRMGTPVGGNQQGMMQQSGNAIMSGNPSPNQNIMMARGLNVNMNHMHPQQRPMTYGDQNNMQRMRPNGPPDQMRMMGPGTQRFQRVGVMNQEMMLRARSHQNQYQNPNQLQMIMSPGGSQHYVNVQRVPFSNQSPTGQNTMGIGNLRSPLPMNSMGGLGSPPGQVMIGQNRVSPASSPMQRRPSGSSLGVASPIIPDRPQSVENPLSSPHTPSSMSCPTPIGVDGMNVHQHSSNSDGSHFHTLDNMTPQDPGLPPHGMQNYGMPNVSTFSSTMTTTTHSDYGGGGGSNSQSHQLIPFPTFSFFNGPVKLGLKGGSPFSVVNGSPSNVVPEQSHTQATLDSNILNSESFQPVVNHNSTAIERTVVSPLVTTNTEVVSTTATTDLVHASSVSTENSTTYSSLTVSLLKEVRLEPYDSVMNAVPAIKKEEVACNSSSVVFVSTSQSSLSSSTGQTDNNTVVTDAVRLNVTTAADTEGIELNIKKEIIDQKPTLNSDNSGIMKKLVVVPKSGVQYLVAGGLNNMLQLHSPTVVTTSNFLGASSHTIVDGNSENKIELPPSSVHQSNVGVLGGFRPTKSQAVISQLIDQNRLMQTIQSFDPSKLQNISHMQGTPVSLASFVADAVNAASLPFPQASKAGTQGTFVSTSMPLITVYSRPEMKNQHTNLTAVLLTSPPRLTTSVVNSQQQQGGLTKVTQSGESQNALLKQLLQNTACASMGQTPTDTTGFSLTSFSKRPSSSIPIHTSLSEAASRIPQPTPIIRPQLTTTAAISQASSSIRLPIKIQVQVSESLPTSMGSVPQLPPPPPPTPPSPQVPKRIIDENIKQQQQQIPPPPPPSQTPPVVMVQATEEKLIVEPPKESPMSKLDSISTSAKETIDAVASEKSSFETAVLDAKKADDEVKKAKRRQYQAKRRQSMGKETTPKKRMRKGSKLEEDYDSYMENLITQIRQLPPVGIVEPELGRNYNVCPVYGAGDYSKVNTKYYDLQQGDLLGSFGHATVNCQSDYYNTRPFGFACSQPSPKSQSTTQRGFYNQEFASPKLGSHSMTYGDKRQCDDRSPTPFRDCDTPDTIVSSSSPECVMNENSFMFPGLRLIDDDEEERKRHLRDSPIIPIVAPIPIRPVLQAEQLSKTLTDDIDKENRNTTAETFVMKGNGTSGAMSPLKDNGNLTVTLTLSSNAAEDIGGVLRNLANVLSISAPSVYQIVERTTTPPSQKLGLYTYKGKDGKEFVDIQGILNGAAKFCHNCDVVVLSNVIRKKVRDLPGIITSADSLDGTDELYFCSTTCFMQFAMTHGVTLPSEDKAGAVVRHPSELECQSVVKSEKNKLPLKNSKLLEADIIKEKSNKPGKEIVANSDTSGKLKRSHPSNDVKVKEESEVPGKKWKGIKYKKWLPTTPHSKYKKPTEKEMTEMLFRMRITVAPAKIPDDIRKCMFCHQIGDGVSDGPARLLNYDVDKWVHLNCALWSEEVYETENGALVNVEAALKQSVVLICIACKQNGATVKCFKTRCSSVYHLGCAVKEGCVFYKNKAVYCSAHVPKGEKENELTTLSVGRRVYIQRDENRQVAAVMHHADQHHLLRVGSLIFLNVGQLLPHQLQNFHTANCIYPIGYKIMRFYWSMKRTNKRCQYICSIHEMDGKPEFRISPQEEGCKDLVIKADSAQGAWHQVLDSISEIRNASNTIKVFPKYITGEDLFGLTEPAIVKVLESLPGIETLTDYHFKYGRNPLLELPLAINPTGCARGEPKLRTHFKRPHTQRTGGSKASTSMSSSVLSSSEAACPYSKQFVHSKSSQYKKMKQDWRNNVYLARSKIQGLGLYAARDIEKHTMVIEYIGEIIRSELAELREKRYEAQNRGIYMFRVDEDRVIDATLCGGLARYINHSCNPNCVAETVEVDRDWRIIIFANRRISRGEELAYDYKFEFEDDQHKIQCFCGASNCRQWMN